MAFLSDIEKQLSRRTIAAAVGIAAKEESFRNDSHLSGLHRPPATLPTTLRRAVVHSGKSVVVCGS
jgi:hypothetical protein